MTAMKLTCHCGAVELRVTPSVPFDQARHCDCSFCRRRAAATLTVPLDALEIVKGADNLALYTWGTGTAQHHFCKTCGIYTHHQRRSNPNEYGVNLGALEGVNPAEWEPLPWHDGVNHPSDRQT
ncbi:GFA family protein [Alisedimentitalea sp. MJ-SS2]|uniref:GFA family protein n=1 Tax=Aliisedimentitalea sp. MJ-SS2 TaxID=3049795 RepID=UPI00290A0418|nr:GFA family protein [Alisedimentitalea sp. MJ-SS2]MDU8927246.1 GFA family protein [Alisedimentitalea sp. MJ-SS2]